MSKIKRKVVFSVALLVGIFMVCHADASIDIEREYKVQILANSISTPMACKLLGQRHPNVGIDVGFMTSEVESYKEEVDTLNAEDRKRLADNIYQYMAMINKADCEVYYRARKDMIKIFKLE